MGRLFRSCSYIAPGSDRSPVNVNAVRYVSHGDLQYIPRIMGRSGEAGECLRCGRTGETTLSTTD